MKSLTIAGGIGKDAVTRNTQQGDKVTGFSVGVSEGFGDSKRTIWFDVSMWGNRGEKLAQHLTKGSRVVVTGDLSTREHEGKTYLTLRAADVTLMGGGNRDEGQSQRGGYDQSPDRGRAPARDDLESDIPF
ncbi:MAG: single-stranded DNA-binding protein [Alphaproteobacteria bacterium]|nr:MAG: single-stranded DNA-binding protein [Alphaproteobacteria bacterium]